jgi:uncharacterized protein YabN with tetrapyrrole methylase and pyrophosphatase domain
VPTGRLHSPGYTFDHTFGNGDDNATVYRAVVRPLVELAATRGGVVGDVTGKPLLPLWWKQSHAIR